MQQRSRSWMTLWHLLPLANGEPPPRPQWSPFTLGSGPNFRPPPHPHAQRPRLPGPDQAPSPGAVVPLQLWASTGHKLTKWTPLPVKTPPPSTPSPPPPPPYLGKWSYCSRRQVGTEAHDMDNIYLTPPPCMHPLTLGSGPAAAVWQVMPFILYFPSPSTCVQPSPPPARSCVCPPPPHTHTLLCPPPSPWEVVPLQLWAAAPELDQLTRETQQRSTTLRTLACTHTHTHAQSTALCEPGVEQQQQSGRPRLLPTRDRACINGQRHRCLAARSSQSLGPYRHDKPMICRPPPSIGDNFTASNPSCSDVATRGCPAVPRRISLLLAASRCMQALLGSGQRAVMCTLQQEMRSSCYCDIEGHHCQ